MDDIALLKQTARTAKKEKKGERKSRLNVDDPVISRYLEEGAIVLLMFVDQGRSRPETEDSCHYRIWKFLVLLI